MVTSWLRAQGATRAGGLTASAIATVWLTAGVVVSLFAAEVEEALELVLVLFAPATVIVFFLGRRLAKRAVSSRRGLWATFLLGALTVALNAYAVGWLIMAAIALSPRVPGQVGPDIFGLVGGPVAFALVGLLFVGWIAIGPALLSAGLWTFVMRRLFPRAQT